MLGPGLRAGYEQAMRLLGKGPVIDLVRRLQAAGEADHLPGMEVDEALAYLWPRLQDLSSES